jgi:hypothetical protein
MIDRPTGGWLSGSAVEWRGDARRRFAGCEPTEPNDDTEIVAFEKNRSVRQS